MEFTLSSEFTLFSNNEEDKVWVESLGDYYTPRDIWEYLISSFTLTPFNNGLGMVYLRLFSKVYNMQMMVPFLCSRLQEVGNTEALDEISKLTGYKTYHAEVEKVRQWLDSIILDDESRQYALTYLSHCLKGDCNNDQMITSQI